MLVVRRLTKRSRELPDRLRLAWRRQWLSAPLEMELKRELGSIENLLKMEPPEELISLDEELWQSLTEGVLRNLKFLNKEMCCFASVGACGVAMLTFSILEASGNVRVDTTWFVLLLVWFLLSLLGACVLKFLGLVLFDAATRDLMGAINERLEGRFCVTYRVERSCRRSRRSLELWGEAKVESSVSFVNYGSSCLAYAMPIPEPGAFGMEAMPAPRANEVELLTDPLETFQAGESVCSEVRRLSGFSFRLVVYPRGLSEHHRDVAAFVEAQEEPEGEWSKLVKFKVTLMNCIDYRSSLGRIDEGVFSNVDWDRGWADLLPQELATPVRGWVSASGGLLIRAACSLKSAPSPTLYGAKDDETTSTAASLEEGSVKAKKEQKEDVKVIEVNVEVKEEVEEVKELKEDFEDMELDMYVPSEPMASAVLVGPFTASQREEAPSAPVAVMANFDCPEPRYVAPPSIAPDTSELPV